MESEREEGGRNRQGGGGGKGERSHSAEMKKLSGKKKSTRFIHLSGKCKAATVHKPISPPHWIQSLRHCLKNTFIHIQHKSRFDWIPVDTSLWQRDSSAREVVISAKGGPDAIIPASIFFFFPSVVLHLFAWQYFLQPPHKKVTRFDSCHDFPPLVHPPPRLLSVFKERKKEKKKRKEEEVMLVFYLCCISSGNRKQNNKRLGKKKRRRRSERGHDGGGEEDAGGGKKWPKSISWIYRDLKRCPGTV